MSVWINGSMVPEEEARISVFDHGLVVGDGVFETVKVVAGTPFALSRHLARLRASALALGLPEHDSDQLRAAAAAVIDASPRFALARLRITVTGGVAPLGSERAGSPLTMIVALAEQRPHSAAADVAVVPWSRNEHGAMAGIKTTSYAENVRALAYASERGCNEAIFANTANNLCEGTGSNVFVVLGGRLITPPLAAGCLAGVTRALVIEWAGAVEEDLPVAVLAEANEAFLTSTTRDVQPIQRVNESRLAEAPGPVTRKAADIFAMRAAESSDP
jgi:branched-chain amino acid aminotransferase